MKKISFSWAILAGLMVAAGCGDDSGPAACQDGDVEACTCMSGAMGQRTCADGTFGTCVCAAPMDAGPGCTDGESQACTCAGGGSGTQTCSGGSFGTCECGTMGCVPYTMTGCDANEWCIPDPAGGATGSCGAAGAGAEGTDCTADGDCMAGLICEGGLCLRACEPDAPSGAAGDTCTGANEMCFPLQSTDEVGTCFPTCTPFTDDPVAAGCQTGEWCQPSQFDISFGGCVPAGEAALGAACDDMTPATTCVAGAICLGGTCTAVCDRDAADGAAGDTCADGEACFGGLTAGDQPVVFGICQVSCMPFQDPPDATCDAAAMEWCFPAFDDATIGQCQMAGTVAPGGTCDGTSPATSCTADHLCIGMSCSQLCLPAATTGMPGACPDLDVCLGLALSDGTALDFGSCNPGCDLDDTGMCADASLTCTAAELLQNPDNPPLTNDVCLSGITSLAEGADCGAAGLGEFSFCGGTSICLASMPGAAPTCVETCRTSAGAFGTMAHPDCTRADATCAMAFTGITTFGICN